MADYEAPEHGKNGFNCPHCGAYAHQEWRATALADCGPGPGMTYAIEPNLDVAMCSRCDERSVWVGHHMVYPAASAGPLPNPDMPEEARADYEEARAILALSPRGACALLRLVVQKLCIALGEPGKDLNKDIGKLVAERGLLPGVQKALDSVRVIGNESVHPGELDMKDNQKVAAALFAVTNVIVERLISADKEIDALYALVPEGKRAGIEQRDAPKA
jgi:hypothetical protein